jgi:predicted MFS family arabinose efflux permease
VSIPAFAEVHGSRAQGAYALACWASGSLLGGLWIGTRKPPRRPDLRFAGMLALLAAALVPPIFAPSLPVLCVLMLIAGVPIAPAFAASYGLVDELSLPGTSTEAFAWITTAIVAGVSVGTAVGGLVIEHAGSTESLALGAPCAAIGALLVIARRSSLRSPASLAASEFAGATPSRS